MPPNPKRTPPRGRPSPVPPARRRAEVELPFDDDEVAPLRADDPRPQHVPQYPSGKRRPRKPAEEAIPTSVYDVDAEDRELPQSFDPAEVSDGGHRPAFLYVEKGPGQGQLVPLRQGPTVIGRASISDLRLQHPSISRRHCQLTRIGERFYVKDLGSQNGTFVNKTRISTEMELTVGDEIAVGNASIRLRGSMPGEHAGQKVRSTRRKSRPETEKPRNGSAVARVAIFAGAVGFGLAGVLAFALFKVPRGPTYQTLGGPVARVAPAGAESDPVVEVDGDAVVKVEHEKKVDQALRQAMSKRGETARAEAPAAASVASSRKAAPASSRKPAVVAKADAPAADEEGDSGERAEILAKYEAGNAEGALEAAKRAGDRDLTAKLSRFVSAYDAARAAVRANNGGVAVKQYEAALKLDEGLSSGWSRYGGEIRTELSKIYTIAGLEYVDQDEPESARNAFGLALKHDPSNAKAKSHLAKLGGSSKAKAKSKIDEVWEDEAPVRKPAKAEAAPKPSRAAAIDDAFGD